MKTIRITAAAALLAAIACGPGEAVQQRLAELEAVAAEKDSLLVLVTENAHTMSEIGSVLAQVEPSERDAQALQVSSESPLASSRDSLVARVRLVTTRLQDAENRLAESRRRIRTLASRSDSMSARVQNLEASLATFETTLATQRATLDELNGQIVALKDANRQLASERLALADSLTTVAAEAAQAYYVIGTEDELIERGIVRKEGGARFLFLFGRRGETLVPACDLDPALFTPIDARTVREIPLPDTTAAYVIASRQDMNALATPLDDHGRITATTALRIAEPGQFWQGSRFLIVVRRS